MRNSPFAYIRQHPFSTMALCNIMGDLGYLGFAFAAAGFVSVPKLLGSIFTMAAHVILLAYGDDQARHVASERGVIPRFILGLRRAAQNLAAAMPEGIARFIRAKPVGIPFAMLSLNGLALLVDAVGLPHSLAAIAQTIMGIFILLGCGSFSLADFVPGQKAADRLLRLGPSFLLCVTAAHAVLAVLTLNPFLIASLLIFLTSNLAGFYTKIDKHKENPLSI